MTGDVVVSRKIFAEASPREKIIIDWTSDGSGNVVTDQIDTIGFVYEIERVPGANGDLSTDTPSASYNTYIKDPYGCALIEKAGDGSATAAQRDLQTDPLWVDDYMVVSITAAGAANSGRLIIWLLRSLNA